MSTADVARDLDLLRRAVGDAKLTYLGFSYGSYLGNTYANLFPRNVRALVIDGVLDPRLWSSGWQIRSDRVATQQEFDEFLRLCDEAGPRCAFGAGRLRRALGGAGRGARGRAARPRRRLALHLRPPDRRRHRRMYAPEIWGGAMATALLRPARRRGAGRPVCRGEPGARGALIDRLQPAQHREADYDNGFDAYFGNQCADTRVPEPFVDVPHDRPLRARRLAVRPVLVVVQRRLRRLAGRARSLRRARGRPGRRHRSSSSATSSTASPTTPVPRRQRQLLRNSRLLSYAGWGHTAYGRSDCTTRARRRATCSTAPCRRRARSAPRTRTRSPAGGAPDRRHVSVPTSACRRRGCCPVAPSTVRQPVPGPEREAHKGRSRGVRRPGGRHRWRSASPAESVAATVAAAVRPGPTPRPRTSGRAEMNSTSMWWSPT